MQLHHRHVQHALRRGSSAMQRTHIRCAAAAPTSAAVVPRTAFKSDAAYQFAGMLNGCWQLAGGHGRDVYENIYDKLDAHAAAGFTTFDTADIYGPSEKILGEWLAQRRDSGQPAVQVFTKYVPNIFQQSVTPAAVEAAVRRSCSALQVSQLDCVQLHWWDYSIPGMVDTMKALADCQSKGLIRHVATTNMDCQALSKILAAGVPVAANQVQFSLLDRRPLNGMVQLAQQHGIKLLTYGSVGGGLLSDKYVVEAPKPGLFGMGQPRYPAVDLNTSSLKMYWNIVKQMGGQDLWRELLAVLKAAADKHEVSTANVALRWVMQQGDGETVHPIVGLRSTIHIQDNARVFTFALDDTDMQQIGAVLVKARGPAGDIYAFERGG